MNPKYASRERIIHFTLGGGLIETIGGKQIELPPVDYRAYYDEFDDGAVCVTQLQRKVGDTWLRDKLWNELDESLTAALEADIADEQQEMVRSFDEHAWRTAS